MPERYPPINAKCPHFLHGGDYNPDQWIETLEVWTEDMRLAKLAGVNAMSVGIFGWSMLEPSEGRFDFSWLDRVMDMLADNNMFAVLATPSGSKPAWLSRAYPETCRVNAERHRELHGQRHNHCYTSPAYREKVAIVNRKLAERYGDHPALLVWHVSNEYSGECHCELCQGAFRGWLRRRYGHDIDRLNRAWWTRFWSHRYNDFDQVESPSPIGERSIHGLNLDWRRFVSDRHVDFFRAECDPLREMTPEVPVTTNFMGLYPIVNYWAMAPYVDRASWDSYPPYHDRDDDWRHAVRVSFVHDLERSLKGGQPFMLMECSPSVQNWKPVNKLKRPGVHVLEAMQAVAHGADTIQYFQWRKSRGGCEKFHGAVVDHAGHEHNRVFEDVAEVGRRLAAMDDVLGTSVQPEVAIVYDWENRWAIDDTAGPRNERKDYAETCVAHYRPFWQRGVAADVVNMDGDFSKYKVVVAPMLYMVRPGVAERIEAFVKAGGVFVTTYLSGIADESDLCFLGGFPGPLRPLLGVWAEEIDVLYDDEHAEVTAVENNAAGLSGTYRAACFCDLIHTEGAEVLASYSSQFYAGRPAVTVNRVGEGRAYYVASRNDDRFHDDLFGRLIDELGLRRVLSTDLPTGVTAQERSADGKRFVFLLNFTRDEQTVELDGDRVADNFSGEPVTGSITLEGYGSRVLVRG